VPTFAISGIISACSGEGFTIGIEGLNDNGLSTSVESQPATTTDTATHAIDAGSELDTVAAPNPTTTSTQAETIDTTPDNTGTAVEPTTAVDTTPANTGTLVEPTTAVDTTPANTGTPLESTTAVDTTPANTGTPLESTTAVDTTPPNTGTPVESTDTVGDVPSDTADMIDAGPQPDTLETANSTATDEVIDAGP